MTTRLHGAFQRFDPGDEPGRPEALRTAICEETSRQCVERYGEGLRAVVLAGSLGRDEATFVREGECWRLLGDAEFLLIFHERTGLPAVPALDHLRRKIGEGLFQRNILCPISLSGGHPTYLRKLKPHIFAYEMQATGQVVWGDKSIPSLIPAFSPAEIPQEDAWRLLCNRMIEQLEVVGDLSSDAALPPWVLYRTVKLYLDMATSLLLFAGAYEPSYQARAERLGALAESAALDGDCPFPPRRFAEQVAACTRWKLSPQQSPLAATWEFWEEGVSRARSLWRWELARLTGCREPLSDVKLCRRWMRRQPLPERLRGWLYVLRSCGWHRSWRHWPRWARCAWQASPRYWVYAAGSQLFFRLPSLVRPANRRAELEADWEGMRSRLPVVGKSDQGKGVAAWKRLAADIVWNYHQLLEGTRS